MKTLHTAKKANRMPPPMKEFSKYLDLPRDIQGVVLDLIRHTDQIAVVCAGKGPHAAVRVRLVRKALPNQFADGCLAMSLHNVCRISQTSWKKMMDKRRKWPSTMKRCAKGRKVGFKRTMHGCWSCGARGSYDARRPHGARVCLKCSHDPKNKHGFCVQKHKAATVLEDHGVASWGDRCNLLKDQEEDGKLVVLADGTYKKARDLTPQDNVRTYLVAHNGGHELLYRWSDVLDACGNPPDNLETRLRYANKQ